MDGKAHLLARGAQLAGQFRDTLLRLRHGHAVARNDDHAVGLVQCRGDTVGVDGDLFALDRLLLARGAAEAAEDHADEAAVHRLAHDVAEDRTGRTHQRTDHDQQVIAEREADGRRRPARVAVEHRDDDGHVRAADPHDQVIADEQTQQRQKQERPCARPAEIHRQQDDPSQRRLPAFSMCPPGSCLAAVSILTGRSDALPESLP